MQDYNFNYQFAWPAIVYDRLSTATGYCRRLSLNGTDSAVFIRNIGRLQTFELLLLNFDKSFRRICVSNIIILSFLQCIYSRQKLKALEHLSLEIILINLTQQQ